MDLSKSLRDLSNGENKESFPAHVKCKWCRLWIGSKDIWTGCDCNDIYLIEKLRYNYFVLKDNLLLEQVIAREQFIRLNDILFELRTRFGRQYSFSADVALNNSKPVGSLIFPYRVESGDITLYLEEEYVKFKHKQDGYTSRLRKYYFFTSTVCIVMFLAGILIGRLI